MITEADYTTPHTGPYNADEYIYVVHRIVDNTLRA